MFFTAMNPMHANQDLDEVPNDLDEPGITLYNNTRRVQQNTVEHLKLPFPIDEILSGYDDIVSWGTVQFTTWVKTDPDATLVRHMVDVQKSRRRISRGIRKET